MCVLNHAISEAMVKHCVAGAVYVVNLAKILIAYIDHYNIIAITFITAWVQNCKVPR